MSDSLGTLSQATQGLPVLSGLSGYINGLLSAASWRGVPFYMKTSDETAGPRVAKFTYPGQAKSDFQFMGPDDGPIEITGLLIGTDSVRQATKMRAACQASGPGKLRHPWFGLFDAVLTEKPHFNVSEDEFGLVRFTATFERYLPVKPPTPDFFGQLQDAVDGLMSAATDLLSDVMDQLAGPLALFSFASGLLTTAVTLWDGLGLGAGGSAVQGAVAPSVLALSTAAPGYDSSFAATASALLAAPCTALADASQPVQAPAIGAGPAVSVAAASIDPAVAGPVLLSAAAAFAASATASSGAQAIALSAQMQAVAQAAAIGSTISFASTEDAAAWRDKLDAAIGTIQQNAATLTAAIPLTAGPALRAIAAVRQAALADNNARAVNLPSLASLTTTRTSNAWRLALTLFGNNPGQMQAAVIDLWNRNLAARNPGALPAGAYQVLPA